MKDSRRYTIHDVARLAGTSATTVSRVLNNIDYPVSDKLKKQVLKAASELNFSPNTLARNLKNATSNEIGVVVPTISNPFYSSAILGIEQVVIEHGYNILLCNTFRQKEREREYLRMLYDKRVGGVIISAVTERGNNVVEFAERGMKFVLLDQKLDGVNCNNIHFDSREGARMAVKHLIDNGHKRIAFVTTPLTRWTRNEICRGYHDAFAEAAIGAEPIVFEAAAETENAENDYENIMGRQLADEFADKKCPATGVLCVNDMVALGFIQGLNMRGIKVPRDVSVIGFDDIPFAAMFSPPLTTVRCSGLDLGRMAGRLLIESLSGEQSTDANLKMEPFIVVRQTVRNLNK